MRLSYSEVLTTISVFSHLTAFGKIKRWLQSQVLTKRQRSLKAKIKLKLRIILAKWIPQLKRIFSPKTMEQAIRCPTNFATWRVNYWWRVASIQMMDSRITFEKPSLWNFLGFQLRWKIFIAVRTPFCEKNWHEFLKLSSNCKMRVSRRQFSNDGGKHAWHLSQKMFPDVKVTKKHIKRQFSGSGSHEILHDRTNNSMQRNSAKHSEAGNE